MQTAMLDPGLPGLSVRPQPDAMIAPESSDFLDQLVLEAPLPVDVSAISEGQLLFPIAAVLLPNPPLMPELLPVQFDEKSAEKPQADGQTALTIAEIQVQAPLVAGRSVLPDEHSGNLDISSGSLIPDAPAKALIDPVSILPELLQLIPESDPQTPPRSLSANGPFPKIRETDVNLGQATEKAPKTNPFTPSEINALPQVETQKVLVSVPAEKLGAPTQAVAAPDREQNSQPQNSHPQNMGDARPDPAFPIEIRLGDFAAAVAIPRHPAVHESALRLQLKASETHHSGLPPGEFAAASVFPVHVPIAEPAQPITQGHDEKRPTLSGPTANTVISSSLPTLPLSLPIAPPPLLMDPAQTAKDPTKAPAISPSVAVTEDARAGSVLMSAPYSPPTADRVSPAAPQPAHTAETATIVQQTATVIAAQKTDQPGRIELTLTPETLGRLHFDMRPEGNLMAITLSAEHPETLDLMRRHLPELMVELKQAGVQAGTLSFGTWSEGRHAPPQQPVLSDPIAPAFSPPLPSTPQHRAAPKGSGGLDLRL